jgi:hypothetical protein
MLPESKLSESKAVRFTAEWGWIVLSNNECIDGIDVCQAVRLYEYEYLCKLPMIVWLCIFSNKMSAI